MPVTKDVQLGDGVKIFHPELVNLYGCQIGDGTTIGPFVEIQHDVVIGARCKISSHSFICRGVTLEDEVFIGHGAKFVNDLTPRATTIDGSLQNAVDWQLATTHICKRASIGTNATILGNLNVGENAMIGAGAVVTRDVPANSIVAGVPARIIGYVDEVEAVELEQVG